MKLFWQLTMLLTLNISSAQQIKYEVFNTSVNSEYAEIGTIFLDDNTVLFASSQRNADDDKLFKKDRRKNNRQLHLDLYKGKITPNGDVFLTGKFFKTTNNPFYESDITFTNDFKTVYFTWNNFYNTQSVKDSAKWKTLQIVKADFHETNRISNIQPLPFNNKKYSIRNPKLSFDQKKLFFVSDMPGGFGETDIYMVDIFEDGTYGTPQNLGENVNTKKAELFPFVDQKNNLYFSSTGYGSNVFNIFKSEYKNATYAKAEKLPSPINSAFDDFAFTLFENGEKGFFTSNRADSKGDVDIYAFYTVKPCNQQITGTIFNNETHQKLNNSKVVLVHDNEIIETVFLKNNQFNFHLKCNEFYELKFSKEGFYPTEIKLHTNNENEMNNEKEIQLNPIICEQTFEASVVEANTKKPLQNAFVKIYKYNDLIDSLQLQLQTTFSYKLNCNSQYRFVVSLENYTNDVAFIKTSDVNNEVITKEFILESNPEFVLVKNQKMIKTNPLQFDLDKSDIREDTAEELTKVVDILNKYPNLKLEVKSHTDSRAPDEYNMKISNSRAQSIINFIISKGIASERVSGKGYGETQLLNHCSNGVKCSENEHLINRRTEFIVTEN